MGYFNYFIKCIIRKFVNLLFKPKLLITFLIIISILFLLQLTSRAEWSSQDISDLQTTLSRLRTVLIEQLNELEQIKNNTQDVEDQIALVNEKLLLVNSYLYNIQNNTDDIETQLSDIVSQLIIINSDILNIYNKLEENQQELLTELKTENKAVLDELNMIRDAINGSEDELTTFTDLGIIHDTNFGYMESVKCISLDYENKYTYTIKLTYNSPYSIDIGAFSSDNLIPYGFKFSNYSSEFSTISRVPTANSDYVVTYQVPSTHPKYIYFTWGRFINKIEVYRSIKGITESLNQSNDLQQQQNQLQQQQNQLQQEQNNFLQQGTSDSDVSVDSFNNVESNDITSIGLNGVFNSIYSSITSWNSKNINLPIPYTDKSIVIPANYTENMLNSSGGGWIITFIHAVYYFIVGRFMIYSITNIVNSIKSGSILNTNSKNNITMDML